MRLSEGPRVKVNYKPPKPASQTLQTWPILYAIRGPACAEKSGLFENFKKRRDRDL